MVNINDHTHKQRAYWGSTPSGFLFRRRQYLCRHRPIDSLPGVTGNTVLPTRPACHMWICQKAHGGESLT